MYFPVLLGLSILPVVGRVCVCVCVRAAACCPLLPPRPVTQLRTGPTLFRDVLIKKQRWTSESHAGCRTGTVTQCRSLCSGDGRAGLLAGNMAASDSPAKNKDVVSVSARSLLRKQTRSIILIIQVCELLLWFDLQPGNPPILTPPTHESCHIISNVSRLLHPGCSTGATNQL